MINEKNKQISSLFTYLYIGRDSAFSQANWLLRPKQCLPIACTKLLPLLTTSLRCYEYIYWFIWTYVSGKKRRYILVSLHDHIAFAGDN